MFLYTIGATLLPFLNILRAAGIEELQDIYPGQWLLLEKCGLGSDFTGSETYTIEANNKISTF